MEYFLIERDENGESGSYMVRRSADLADMRPINRLTELVASAIIDLVEDAPWLFIERPYTGMDTTPSGFGARIYVSHDVYELASKQFMTIVDNYVARFRKEQEAATTV